MHPEFELEPGEEVIEEVRKHWFFFAGQLLPFAILALVPLALPTLIKIGGPNLTHLIGYTGLSTPLGRLALGAWWLLLWCAAWSIFTRYFLNAWIITNDRIVEIEQRGFFSRQVSSLLLSRVQDVTIDTEGALRSLLGVGIINVQTAGREERFTMGNVPHPEKLRDEILLHVAKKEPGA